MPRVLALGFTAIKKPQLSASQKPLTSRILETYLSSFCNFDLSGGLVSACHPRTPCEPAVPARRSNRHDVFTTILM